MTHDYLCTLCPVVLHWPKTSLCLPKIASGKCKQTILEIWRMQIFYSYLFCECLGLSRMTYMNFLFTSNILLLQFVVFYNSMKIIHHAALASLVISCVSVVGMYYIVFSCVPGDMFSRSPCLNTDIIECAYVSHRSDILFLKIYTNAITSPWSITWWLSHIHSVRLLKIADVFIVRKSTKTLVFLSLRVLYCSL